MKKLLFILAFIVYAPQTYAAIAFDSASAAQTGSSWSHTVTGSNPVLIVTGIDSADYGGITWNTTENFTKAKTVTSSLGSHIQIWYLLNPTTGTHTISLTHTNGRAQSASYTGVSQTGFPDASASGANISGSGNITTPLSVVATGSWVVGTNEDQTIVPDAGVVITSLRGGETNYGNGRLNDSNGAVSTGTNNVGYHYAGSNTVTIATLSFAPFVAPSVSAHEQFTLFGDW